MNGIYEFLSMLFAELSKASIQYCVLRNWHTLPEVVGNDVDLWVAAEDGIRFEEILYKVAQKLGWRLARRLYWLGYPGEGLFVFVKLQTREYIMIDTYRHLAWKGLKYVEEDFLYKNACPHEKGFRVLKPGAEAVCLVMKELLFEGGVRARYYERIRDLVRTDKNRFIEGLMDVLNRKMTLEILRLILSGKWNQLKRLRWRLILKLATRRLVRTPLITASLCMRHFYLRAKERVQPWGGFLLVLIGPDGAGKTTIAKALLKSPFIKRLFSAGVYIYRRFPLFPELKTFLPSFLKRRLSPSLNLTTGMREDEAPAGIVRCTLYLLYYGLEYFLGRIWLWKVSKRGNRIIVFDRYWYEFIFQRWYQRCPKFLLNLLGILAAKPDALIFLDVTPEVAYKRKREKPLTEIQRLHRLCKETIVRSPNGYTLRTNEIDQAVRKLEEIIVEQLTERSLSRMTITPR